MFYPQPTVGMDVVKSDIQVLSEQFLRGDVMTMELSEYVFGNMVRTRESSYYVNVGEIKQILSSSKIDYHYDLMIIKSSANLAEEQKTVLVRFINLCEKHRDKIVIFNGNVIYIPEEFKRFCKEILDIHIHSSYREYTKKRKFKVLARKFSIKKIIPFLYLSN